MTKKDLETIRQMIDDSIYKVVPPTIERTVNGKIKEVKELIETHIIQHTQDTRENKEFQKEMKPFMQAKTGGAILFKGLLGAGSIAIAWVALKSVFPTL